MNRANLRTFAPDARRALLDAVKVKAMRFGIAKDKDPEPATIEGDFARIAGIIHPRKALNLREKLIDKINQHGFDAVMEEAAYIWFNRLMAIRYMEAHRYFPHGLRVLSDPKGGMTPEVLQQAQNVNIPTLDKARVLKLLTEGNRQDELFQTLLLAQCHALGEAMPFLFDGIDGATELLLPDNLLAPNSVVRKLVNEIPEDDWKVTEVLGWLYQFYVLDEKARVDAYVKKGQAVQPEDIPAKTQLFTPNWIVQFLTQNSLGRLWMDVYPDSRLREQMPYYTPPAEQEPEVVARLKEITPPSLDPNTLTAIDPAAGSGHILLELYNLFFAMYKEQGYPPQQIPRLILEQNLFGLELDRRAAQIAGFAVLMRARADDPRLLENPPRVNVLAIRHSRDLDLEPLLTQEQAKALFSNAADFEWGQLKLTGSGRPLFSNGAMVKAIKDLFEEADIVGSLQRVPEDVAENLEAISIEVEKARADANLIENEQLALLADLVRQAQVLAGKYSACVANPPYLGGKAMVKELKDFAKADYPETKADLFAMFIERGFDFAEKNGFNAMVTMQSWMFLTGYEKFRREIVENRAICSMVHMGNGVMGIAFGTAATSIRNSRIPKIASTYCYAEMKDLDESNRPRSFPVPGPRCTTIPQSEFKKIPGWPIAYWLSNELRRAFGEGVPLDKLSAPRKGNSTSDNARFLRFWPEVAFEKVGIGLDKSDPKRRWLPYNKGGGFHRWFGNNDYLIDWRDEGAEIRRIRTAVVTNEQYYFKPGITWGTVTSGRFSARYFGNGFLFDNGGCCVFGADELRLYLLGLLNSTAFEHIIGSINPTINFQSGEVSKLPVIVDENYFNDIQQFVGRLVGRAVADWDLTETSWGFTRSYWTSGGDSASLTLEAVTAAWRKQIEDQRSDHISTNDLFIQVYGLGDELEPSVTDAEILPTIYGRISDLRSATADLLSNFVGCMMGRYSLDEPGLIYAHSGGEGFDPSRYRSFPADDDGILPLTDQPFFGDQDPAERFAQWVKTVWPNSSLDENLAFIAANLGGKSNETPMETIRRYLVEDFYDDHLQTYKKRPIYWLFSSGKKRAFQALVYLHRYNPATLSRMRTAYVQPLIGKLQAQVDTPAKQPSKTGSTSESTKLAKEVKRLRDQLDELLEFDQRLHHYALQGIALDLDDGVKVNYGKFSDPKYGDILAKVKEITGGKDD